MTEFESLLLAYVNDMKRCYAEVVDVKDFEQTLTGFRGKFLPKDDIYSAETVEISTPELLGWMWSRING